MFCFGEAILQLKCARRVARAGWNGAHMYLELQVPDAHSKMSLPYVFLRTVQGYLIPWQAAQTDILADDWYDVGPTDAGPGDAGVGE